MIDLAILADQDLRTKIKKISRSDSDWWPFLQKRMTDPDVTVAEVRRIVASAIKDLEL